MTELIGFHTRIKKELKDELKEYCKKEGRSTQFVVEKAIFYFLKEEKSDSLKEMINKIREMEYDPEGDKIKEDLF